MASRGDYSHMRVTTATAEAASKPEWFASWFDSAHYHRLYANRDQAEAGAFIDRLIGHLRPDSGAATLDLGCGSGRHSRSLATRGFNVTGIDLSAGSLARARNSSRHRSSGSSSRTCESRSAMRRFDFVFSLFTSFGYFDGSRRSPEGGAEHRQRRCRRRHGGARLPQRATTPSGIVVATRWSSATVCAIDLTRWSDADAIFKRIVINDPSLVAPLEYVERVARLTLKDFQGLFTRVRARDRGGVMATTSLAPSTRQHRPG